MNYTQSMDSKDLQSGMVLRGHTPRYWKILHPVSEPASGVAYGDYLVFPDGQRLGLEDELSPHYTIRIKQVDRDEVVYDSWAGERPHCINQHTQAMVIIGEIMEGHLVIERRPP